MSIRAKVYSIKRTNQNKYKNNGISKRYRFYNEKNPRSISINSTPTLIIDIKIEAYPN
ncbi:hypothetical protein CBU02nite_22750 [Clostridium butyricum]|uniref:Uncharacterized protein n=1 Tax=Clostridium butyricum TaxID=1492 RepID=A0A512TNC6_CLOBU|nr:hypothetical protein CBU02nite_22750 [Clostridium butyricum]